MGRDLHEGAPRRPATVTRLAAGAAVLTTCMVLLSQRPAYPAEPAKAEIPGSSGKAKLAVKYERKFATKPLEQAQSVRWSHQPYLLGACSICHVSDDPKKPGKLRAPTNTLCLYCHQPMQAALKQRKYVHKPAAEDCSYCHNPHNSENRLLLYRPPRELCNSCHTGIDQLLATSKVQHAPALKGYTCRNCHNPHGSNIEHQLLTLPSDLCLSCHGADGLKDGQGANLINLKQLLKDNPYHHEPVDKKDCSACHGAHGSNYFRLLLADYPMEFYAPYRKDAYALCYACHAKEQSIVAVRTTTLTGFRDGDRNLHAVHVSLPKRGRTCRACHEEHAAPRIHLMRDEVPYGDSHWMLKINYVQTRTGGRCTKTCHPTKEYKNK